jgi:hypothetical protein
MKVTELPVLETLLNRELSKRAPCDLKDVAIVYVHHALFTSISVIKAFMKLGLDTKNIFILGKHYSECKEVSQAIRNMGIYYQPCSLQMTLGDFFCSFVRDINWLWLKTLKTVEKRKIKKIIILDHGGYAAAFIPPKLHEICQIVGVEKTTRGLNNIYAQDVSFPIIELASCASKKILESPLIAEAIVGKLIPYIPLASNKVVCGIIGYGAIGQAVANKFLSLGHKIAIYDNDLKQQKKIKKKFISVNNASELIQISDYIFGCSGKELDVSISKSNTAKIFNKNKKFISCSSEDIEFLPILRFIKSHYANDKKYDPLATIKIKFSNSIVVEILRGGFPINFDTSGTSVSPQDIQLTRALVLASVIQAKALLSKKHLPNHKYMLDPKLQKFISNIWFGCRPVNKPQGEIKQNFQHIDWIKKNSGGKYTSLKI